MALTLTYEQMEQICESARAVMPDECCGILVGSRTGDERVVRAVHPVENVWDGPRGDRYFAEPQAVFRIFRDAEKADLEVIGFYHSHPGGEPVPSRFDAELAWPDHAYVIVGLSTPDTPDVRSWVYDDEERRFAEEAVRVTP